MSDDLSSSLREEALQEEAQFDALHKRVEKLRIHFERYFTGIDRIPPLMERTQLERDMRSARVAKSRRTEVRFRMTSLRQRLATYARYWDRLLRQIEEEGFPRDRRGGPSPLQSQPSDAPALSAEETDKLFAAWCEAQTSLGQESQIDLAAFRQRLEKKRQQQMNQKGWTEVDFSVRVRGGKVRLVARKGGSD